MNFGITPDLAAMAVLMAILLLLRRRHPKKSVDLWLLGLAFIFVEDIARFFYNPNPHAFLHRPSHIVALDAYILAGLIFSVGGGHQSFSRLNRFLYIAVNTIPLLAVPTLYGWTTPTAACSSPAASPDSSSVSSARWPFAADGLSFWLAWPVGLSWPGL